MTVRTAARRARSHVLQTRMLIQTNLIGEGSLNHPLFRCGLADKERAPSSAGQVYGSNQAIEPTGKQARTVTVGGPRCDVRRLSPPGSKAIIPDVTR